MGKGDKRTRRGKIFKGTFGVTRPRASKLVDKTKKPTAKTTTTKPATATKKKAAK
jgi:30S ribosomal protein S31